MTTKITSQQYDDLCDLLKTLADAGDDKAKELHEEILKR